jgi:hypothetical protein
MVAQESGSPARNFWACRTASPLVLLAVSVAAVAQQAPAAGPLRKDVFVQLEAELKRLLEQAEREPGPEEPTPSRVLSYYLLSGLASSGKEAKGLTPAELRPFGIGKGTRHVKVVDLAEGKRVALWHDEFCARSSTFAIRCAAYCVRRDGAWQKVGGGWVLADK